MDCNGQTFGVKYIKEVTTTIHGIASNWHKLIGIDSNKKFRLILETVGEKEWHRGNFRIASIVIAKISNFLAFRL